MVALLFWVISCKWARVNIINNNKADTLLSLPRTTVSAVLWTVCYQVETHHVDEACSSTLILHHSCPKS